MALADSFDVQARLGRALTDAEIVRVNALLEDASATVIGYCRTTFEDAVPAAVAGVVAKMVTRSLTRASTLGQFTNREQVGPFAVGYSESSASGDVWMTAGDKLALRPYRRGGGLTSVALVGERYEITEDES